MMLALAITAPVRSVTVPQRLGPLAASAGLVTKKMRSDKRATREPNLCLVGFRDEGIRRMLSNERHREFLDKMGWVMDFFLQLIFI